jgi:hypothetical protein
LAVVKEPGKNQKPKTKNQKGETKMASTDKIEVKAKFSLPYKPGMENEPGFVGKSMQVLKIYSPEKIETAQFLLPAAKTVQEWQTALKKTPEDCERHGTTVFARNATGNKGITTLATKYNIKTLTGAGGLGKRLIADAQKVFTLAFTKSALSKGDVNKSYKAVIAWLAAKGEEITQEQLVEAGVK